MVETLYKMRMIDSEQLNIPREIYQRRKHKNKISRIVAKWDERVANEPKVSYRDGEFFVFDGQHTILAREEIAGTTNTPILCKVYTGLTAQDEALLFAKQTGTSSKPRSGETLRANIFGGEEEALAFTRTTESVGLVVDLTGTRYDRHLACVSTALHAYRAFGEKIYTEALQVLMDAWGGRADSLRYEIIKAVTEFVNLYYGEYTRTRLVNRLAKVDPITIRNNILTDIDHPHSKRYIYQIYRLYNGNGTRQLPLKF